MDISEVSALIEEVAKQEKWFVSLSDGPTAHRWPMSEGVSNYPGDEWFHEWLGVALVGESRDFGGGATGERIVRRVA